MQKGFSLVELSIVLVILGLLTGGILAGQNLIRASELRSVVSQFRNIQTATMTFRDKYFALPGDFKDATKFWGVLAGTGDDATCQGTAATATATCNGNGDGKVGQSSTIFYDERFRVWQHLANAGLIEGSYTGVTTGSVGSFELVSGENAPAAKMGQAFWDMVTIGFNGTPNQFDAPSTTFVNLRHDDGTNQAKSPLLPEELWNIDTKLDDGRPGEGKVRTHIGSSTVAPGCATTDDPATAEYALQATVKCHAKLDLY